MITGGDTSLSFMAANTDLTFHQGLSQWSRLVDEMSDEHQYRRDAMGALMYLFNQIVPFDPTPDDEIIFATALLEELSAFDFDRLTISRRGKESTYYFNK
jgi:hypothetical protein